MISKSRRSLSHEDSELWDYVTRSVKRLKRAPRQTAATKAQTEITPEAVPTATKRPAPPGKFSKPKPAKLVQPAATKPAKSTQKPLAPLEPREKRRLSRGQLDVAARIDWHGMRQHDAHAALNRFLTDAHATDARLVLVITGKGKTYSENPAGGEREAGVLRRMTPLWLGEPRLRSIVLGYETAAARHGGEGAIYVRLRRSATP